jgi:ATP-binding protein involved in chromosome partitioning
MSIREGGDNGVPAVMVENSVSQKTYFDLAQSVARQVAMQNASKNVAEA